MFKDVNVLKSKRLEQKDENIAASVKAAEIIPLSFALSVSLGALIYFRLSFEPAWLLISVSVFLGVGLAASLTQIAWSWAMRWLIYSLLGLSLGLLAGKLRTETVAAPMIEVVTGPIMLEGWVIGVDAGPKGQRLRIKPHAIAGHLPEDLPELVRVTHVLDVKIRAGYFVRCWSVLRPPPGPSLPGDYDFRRQAWFQTMGAVGYVQGRCRGGVLGNPAALKDKISVHLARLRRNLAEYTYRASGTRAGGFAAALVSGDRSFMPIEDQESLRAAGLAHLLAISGLHLGIVGGLVYFMARFCLVLIEPLSLRIPVQKPAALAALIAITLYLFLSGASVSTQRAFIMSSVFLMALLLDRSAISFRSFSIAMCCVVFIHPESVFSPGFQMSFAATGALIAAYEAWRSHQPLDFKGTQYSPRFFIKSLIVTSVIASLATAPFAIYHFQRLAPFSILANLMAMPIVSLLSVPSIGLTLCLAPFGLADWGLALFGLSLEMILGIAVMAENLSREWAGLTKPLPSLALLCFLAGLISFILLQNRLRLMLISGALLCGFGAWATSSPALVYWSPSGLVHIKSSGEGYRHVPFGEAEGLGSLRFQGVTPERACLENICTYALQNGAALKIINRLGNDMTDMAELCSPDAQTLWLVRTPTRSEAASACPTILYWSDIQTKGGVEVKQARQGFTIRHAPICSERPWRAC